MGQIKLVRGIAVKNLQQIIDYGFSLQNPSWFYPGHPNWPEDMRSFDKYKDDNSLRKAELTAEAAVGSYEIRGYTGVIVLSSDNFSRIRGGGSGSRDGSRIAKICRNKRSCRD